jgi:hypothetical protein
MGILTLFGPFCGLLGFGQLLKALRMRYLIRTVSVPRSVGKNKTAMPDL